MSDRKPRTDSTTGKIAAFANALAPVLPCPAHVTLREEDIPFWNGIILARERESWNESDLVAAAHLARCRADIEKVQEILDEQPMVVMNTRGTPVPNPHFTIMENLVRRQQALMRISYVHAQATVGSTGTAANKAKAQSDARKKAKGGDEDDGKDRSLLGGRVAQMKRAA